MTSTAPNRISATQRGEEDREVGRRAHMLIWDTGQTAAAIADQAGIDRGSFNRKLRGERGWSVADLLAAADALNTTVAYLVGETDDPHGADPSKLPRLDSNQQPFG